jgi:hypothetical protein
MPLWYPCNQSTKWEKLLLLMHWKFTEQPLKKVHWATFKKSSLSNSMIINWDVYVVGVVGGSGAGTWEISNFES